MLAARADFLSCGLEGPEYLVLHSSSGFLFLGSYGKVVPTKPYFSCHGT